MAGVGYVELGGNAEDARVTEVSLSSLGEAKLAEARRVTAPVYAAIIDGLDESDFDQLLAVLDRLHANLEPFDAPRVGQRRKAPRR